VLLLLDVGSSHLETSGQPPRSLIEPGYVSMPASDSPARYSSRMATRSPSPSLAPSLPLPPGRGIDVSHLDPGARPDETSLLLLLLPARAGPPTSCPNSRATTSSLPTPPLTAHLVSPGRAALMLEWCQQVRPSLL
jgi:hypothetical protein